MAAGLFIKYCTGMKFSYLHMVLNLSHNYLLFIFTTTTTYIYSTKHIKKPTFEQLHSFFCLPVKVIKKCSRFYVYATIVYPPALMILLPLSIEDLVQDALAIFLSGPYPMLFPDILLLCVNVLVPYCLAYRIFCL